MTECECGWCQECFDRYDKEKEETHREQTKDMDCQGCGFCTECHELEN